LVSVLSHLVMTYTGWS